ncbi:MAG: hypothetical protein NT001_03505 [Candidatus Woesearchaeota archaeon]|nr:hypothetical protein [Candidatus Woesearchaeota archaeon]
MKDNVLILDEYKRKKNKSTSLEAYILQIESEIESLIKERKETLYAQLIDSFRDLADHLEPKYIQWWRKLAGTYEKREQEKKKQSEERQARDKDRKIKLREYNTQFFARLLTLIDHKKCLLPSFIYHLTITYGRLG